MSNPKNAVETRANDDVTTNHPQTRRRPGRLRGSATRLSKSGHRIELPDGDALVPRGDLAADLRISSRSLARLNPSTTMVGGVAYVRDKATRQLLADRASKPKRKHRATALTKSMKDQGLIQPIVVRPRDGDGYILVAGHHRLMAARKLKWPLISCIVLDDMEADQAELIEIDENLIRADLSPAERALHIGKRKDLYEKVHPETKKGGAPGRAGGGEKAKTAKLATFARDTATKTRVARRSVERDATRAKQVVVLGEIVDTCLDKGAEIDALAKLPVEKQRSLAETAKRGEPVSAVTALSACDPEARAEGLTKMPAVSISITC